jgi:hypothetical protein
MSRTKQILIFSHILYLISHISYSQIGGNSTYKFLDLPFSAREAALAGNLITVKDDDINLTFHNPALISPGMDNRLALSYVNYISDINYGYAAYSKTFDKIGSFVGGIQYVNYGKFTEADPTGLITGTFKAADYSYNIGYGRQLDSMFSVGATLKTIYSHLDQYTSLGSVVDLGGNYYNAEHLFTASAVVKGMGRQWKTYTDGNREPLPFEVQLGVSKKLAKAPFRVSLIGTHLEKWDLTYEDPANPTPTTDPLTGAPIVQKKWKTFGDKLGRHVLVNVEMLLGKNFALRFGYNYLRRKELRIDGRGGIPGFSFGLGIKISKFNLSYGYAQYSVAGASSHFTITTNLSEFYKKQ